MKKSGINLKKIIFAIIVAIVSLGIIWLLNRPAANTIQKEAIYPMIGSSPIYVEMEDGKELSRVYIPDNDMKISSIDLLLVNTSGDKDASLSVEIIDSGARQTVASGEVLMSEITPGEWYELPLSTYLYGECIYEIRFLPSGCNPYFMKIDGYSLDISLGFTKETDKILSYGDIFYFSIPLVLLIATVLIFLILFGAKASIQAINKVNLIEFFSRFGNEVFLILLFIAIALNIYSTAYVKGVYITADSDGYLREAVNLAAGNGFSYDGLAGYKSWFANWPIIYPLMIWGIMKIAGLNAYLASKIVAIICVALIEISLYIIYRKKAWICALALTNLGFLSLAYHTWSEVPFILFMIIFGGALGRILNYEKPRIIEYVLLFISGTLSWMTRYFGIFVWVVAGAYWLLLMFKIKQLNKEEAKGILSKLIGLMISAFLSGISYLSYLVINKINNGNPTGVSRGTWWDDYHTLTDDLINSLLVEFFNIFRLEVPSVISSLSEDLKTIIIIVICIGYGILIHKLLNRIVLEEEWSIRRYCNRNFVFIVMAIVYYIMFILIRYRSSMDTFYFRFFAPASILLFIGTAGLILDAYDAWTNKAVYFAILVTILTILSIINTIRTTNWTHDNDFYDITTAAFDELYSEIPNKSVVIWSDIDYRSSWYRPDVVSGDLYESDTLEGLKERYYGSDNLCITREYAEVIINEGDYDALVKDTFAKAMALSGEGDRYVVIELRD